MSEEKGLNLHPSVGGLGGWYKGRNNSPSVTLSSSTEWVDRCGEGAGFTWVVTGERGAWLSPGVVNATTTAPFRCVL